MALRMQQEQTAARNAQLAQIRRMQQEAHDAPNTWMGGLFVPIIAAVVVAALLAEKGAPEQYEEVRSYASKRFAESRAGRSIHAALAWARKRGWTLHDVTRVCVSTFFLHEGLAVLENKWTQLEEASHPMWTPFGLMQSMPSWEKGDAMDLILLVTAASTLFNLLPEIGLILLLVDVATDTLDLVVRILLTYITQGQIHVNELTAKKLSLLGVMALVSTHRWRTERARIAERAALSSIKQQPAKLSNGGSHASADGSEGGLAAATEVAAVVEVVSVAVPSLLLLVGRLLMAFIFFYAGGTELIRLLVPMRLSDLDPHDPHNIVWPKLVEFCLAVPFCLGLRTAFASRALAVTLLLEALTCWQFWMQRDMQVRLHSREHASVNVALAGGLLLVQEVGGGKYAFDELLKKAT